MSTPSKIVPGLSLLLLLVTPVVRAQTLPTPPCGSCTVLYDNGLYALNPSTAGLISFTPGGADQVVSNLVTDEFTLTQSATIEGVTFAELTVITQNPLTVPEPIQLNYEISQAPFGAPFPTSFANHIVGGTAFAGGSPIQTPIGNSLQGWNAGFAVANSPVLPPGTYYLTLGAAIDSEPMLFGQHGYQVGSDYWGLTDATSGDAMFLSVDNGTGVTVTRDLNNDPSFQIWGVMGSPVTAVAEPGTLGLMSLALATAIAVHRKRRIWSLVDKVVGRLHPFAARVSPMSPV